MGKLGDFDKYMSANRPDIKPTTLEDLKKKLEAKKKLKAGFNPNQARDEFGRWTDTWATMRADEQSIKDQNYETVFIYDKDGNRLTSIDGTETHVEIDSLPEGAYVLTHNHNNNTSFSRGDLNFLLSSGSLEQIRVIGPNGIVYELTKNGSWPYNTVELNRAWETASDMADDEVLDYLNFRYGNEWESWSWRENEQTINNIQEIFGRYSDRVIFHFVNSTEPGNNLIYTNYDTRQ